ncbi:hypothetical protein VKT23_004305 [Stygiomarasmius scandens]|uniref:RING-type domain-containing protein n=1 Tax=Marasmiellus scandens TaxID=2682957 RepID=A0ABR1JV93_9AGAR
MSEFDFWEFVACAKCQLPFASGSTVPFWLTECGHTVCNNHLNADQSCSVCASPDIQVIPLQQEMDAPMSEWFRSVPHILDAAAFAAKFQQESMASQIRTLKARHQQQRSYTERLKKENAELRHGSRTVEMLMAQLSDQAPYDNQEPSSIVNSNGKRPLIDSAHRPPSTSSSPHSAIGTNRLTIPAGQQPPHLSSNRTTDQTHSYQEELSLVHQRPGSSKFTQ